MKKAYRSFWPACLMLLLVLLLATPGYASVVSPEGGRMTWNGEYEAPPGVTAPVYFDSAKKRAASALTSPIHPVLVILVEFTDQAPVGSDESDWEDALFGASGSVSAYYDEVSYGRLEIVPASETSGEADNGVVDWVGVGYEHPNTGEDTNDANRRLARDAMIAADPYVAYDAYDTNDDGAVDSSELSIIVIAAGYERSFASSYSPSVWGHRWSFSFLVPSPTLDGVIVGGMASGGGYMQYGEWHQSNTSNGHMATIGIMAHELGHDFGLPDLYDVNGGSEGIGQWGIMGSGSWGSAGVWAGDSPAHFCAWSKEFLGFLTPSVVTGGTVSLPGVATDDVVYRINTIDPNQYFLLENRQRVGFDRGLPATAGGVLIWHIDNSAGSLAANNVNNDETHKRVDLEEAEDGLLGYSQLDTQDSIGNQRDAFPILDGGEVLVDSFNDQTVPGATLYSGIYSGVAISNVSAPGPTMTLDVSYTEPEDVDGDGYLPPADCDPDNGSIHPGAHEIVGDGIDQNCRGGDRCGTIVLEGGARPVQIALNLMLYLLPLAFLCRSRKRLGAGD